MCRDDNSVALTRCPIGGLSSWRPAELTDTPDLYETRASDVVRLRTLDIQPFPTVLAPMPRSDEAEWWFTAVYQAVQEIPYGKVTSYGHIARLLGRREPLPD